MRFKIKRSSHDRPPCDVAIPIDEWDYEDYEYWIEVNTLEELIELTKEYGEIIVTPETLEIYDSYRE